MTRTTSRRPHRAALVAALLLAVTGIAGALVAAVAPAPAGAAYGSVAASFGTLSCNGWVGASTPAGAIRADFTIAGGGGRGGGEAPEDDNKGNPGGAGGRVIGRIALDAGDNVYAWLGCGGSSTTGAQGYADGGDGSGAGGGASALCVGPTSSTCTVVAIAGGGGGGGRASDNGAGLCSSGNDGGDGGAANAGSQSSGQNGGVGIGGGRGVSGSGGEPGRGGGGGGGIGVAGENGTSNGSAAGNNTGGLGGRVTSNNNGAVGGSGGSAASAPGAGGGTGHGGDRSSANSIDGGGGGGGYTGGGGGAGGVRRGGTACYSTFSGAGGGGGGASWALNAVTNRSFDSAGGAGGGQGNGAGGNGAIAVTFVTNPAPTGANQNAGTATKGVAKAITLAAADGETGFTCSIVDPPDKGSATLGGASSCTATYTASPGTDGADSFTYRVTDADGRSSATYTVSLTIVNRPPVSAAQTVSATKGVALPITLAASDPDGDAVTCAAGAAGVGSIAGSGCAVSYTAPADTFGSDSFTYAVTDAVGGTSTSTISITIVNTAPTAVDQSFSVGPASETEIVLGGSDADGDATTCAATEPTDGSLAQVDDCTYVYAAPTTPGTYTFTYTRSDGAPSTSAPATVTVTVNEPGVRGVVTSDDTGDGIPGITVRLYEDGVGFTPHVATTDAEGAFDLGADVPEGEYRAIFRDPSQDFVDEWYDDSPTRSGSTPVVFDGDTDLVLEAGLATGAEIDVTISNPGPFTVALYNTAPSGASAVRSVPNVSGATSLRGLPAGTYYVSVTDPSGALVQEWSGNQTARADAAGIDVGPGDEVAAPFTLAPRNTIAGTIIDTEGPVPLVTVQAYGATSGAFVRSTKTDAEGEYALRDLAAGQYKLVFRDTTGAHPVTWYGGGEVIGLATTVTMPNGGAVTVDEQLPVAARMSGTVTGGPGGLTPLAGAKVTLYRDGAAVRTYTTDATGTYDAGGLAAGDYMVLFVAAGHRSEYNLDRTRRADADVVPVADGAEVDLDATLTPT